MLYIPSEYGVVTKAQRAAIYKAVNAKYNQKIIDEAAHTIRIEGFLKYDNRGTHKWLKKSRYLPLGDAKNLAPRDLYEAVWLEPRGWNDKPAAVAQNDENKAPESDGSIAPSSAGSVEPATPIPEPIETRIKTHYSEIAHVLMRYPIISIEPFKGGNATFVCDKSIKGRTCKIAGRIHKSNNIYLFYY